MACQRGRFHRREGRCAVNGAAQLAALVGALAYIAAAPLEMFFFASPAARRFLHVEADNVADVQMWAFVVGFRNLLAGAPPSSGSSSCAPATRPSAPPSSSPCAATCCWPASPWASRTRSGSGAPAVAACSAPIGSSVPPLVALVAAAA